MKLSPVLLFAASPVVSAGLALLIVPLMTWTLSDKIISEFGLFQYGSSALLLLVTCGTDQAFLRELNESHAPSALLRRCIAPCLFIFLILSIFFILSGDELIKECGNSCRVGVWVVPLLLINVGLMVLQRFCAQKARISQQGGAYLLSEIALKMPLVILLLISFLLNKTTISPILLVVIGTGLSAAVLMANNFELWQHVLYQAADKTMPTLRQLMYFGFPMALASIMYWGLGNSGAYFVKIIHGDTETARIIVATSLSNISSIGQAIFSLIWLPILYQKLDKGVTSEYVSNVARRVTVSAVFVCFIVAILLFAAQYLLGEKYQNIAPIATAISVLPLLYTISEVTFVGLLVKRNAKLAMIATLVALLFSLTVNLIFVPLFSAVGAAVTVALSAFIFLFARTELSAKVWEPLQRRYIYLGGISIGLSGVIAGICPAHWGPVSIGILMPYLMFEKKLLLEIAHSILKNKFND